MSFRFQTGAFIVAVLTCAWLLLTVPAYLSADTHVGTLVVMVVTFVSRACVFIALCTGRRVFLLPFLVNSVIPVLVSLTLTAVALYMVVCPWSREANYARHILSSGGRHFELARNAPEQLRVRFVPLVLFVGSAAALLIFVLSALVILRYYRYLRTKANYQPVTTFAVVVE
ncbi:hypothetical protein AAVH_06545 [Aphelenchoides avenae]|nr:hypothetical protein AAVH_06545 [Aphelenchus avenae]